jgi:hypothetical protein
MSRYQLRVQVFFEMKDYFGNLIVKMILMAKKGELLQKI